MFDQDCLTLCNHPLCRWPEVTESYCPLFEEVDTNVTFGIFDFMTWTMQQCFWILLSVFNLVPTVSQPLFHLKAGMVVLAKGKWHVAALIYHDNLIRWLPNSPALCAVLWGRGRWRRDSTDWRNIDLRFELADIFYNWRVSMEWLLCTIQN